jgi:hypothetical protein
MFGFPPSAQDGDRPASIDDVVTRSVELGYRVVDEYVRQGQRAAAGLSGRPLDPGAATGDLQDMLARMAQYTSDFAGIWMEFLDLASRGGLPGARATGGEPSNGTTTAADAPTDDARPNAGVRVEIAATRATEVTVDLRPLTPGRHLVVQGLRALDPDVPRLVAVAVAPDAPDAPTTFRIEVPVDQPPGVYNGVVVEEETSRPVGTVSVRLAPA